MSATIELRGAGVVLRDKTILSGITLSVGPGEFWGVAGPNGAGKSTLVRLVPGFVPLAGGEMRVFGAPLAEWKLTELRRRVGFLPQHVFFDEGAPISAREVILMGRSGRRGLFRRLTAEDRRVAEACAAELGIAGLLDRPIGSLSGGERQRVQLARALAQEPELLILDEPTASLDPRAAVRFLETVSRIRRERGMTVLIVTHEISILPPDCGFVALLREGRLLAAGEKDRLLEPRLLSELYACRVEVEKRAGRYHIFQD
jgi:ABC-type Mn2+/Zn2+ transport system ATPase subunit